MRLIRYISENCPDVEMTAATLKSNSRKFRLMRVYYQPHRDPTAKIHPSLFSTERAVLMGQAAYGALKPLADKGYKPDVIMAHSSWGANLFIRDLFPEAKLLTYFEWYYHSKESDSDFLPGRIFDHKYYFRIRMQNTAFLQDLAAMDWGQCPTRYQHSQFPEIFKDRISVLHDGIDTEYFSPDASAKLAVNGLILTARDEVVSYVARGMDPYRGFPQFMETVAILQKQRPNLQVVVVGADRTAYGARRRDGKTHKVAALEEFELDLSRIHFMGPQPVHVFRELMQITTAHIYLTIPFVLSWSMLEAMSAGALLLASDTDPVREVVQDGVNGVLVPFFEPEVIAFKVVHALDHREQYQEIKDNARQTVLDGYDKRDLLPRHLSLICNIASGSAP